MKPSITFLILIFYFFGGRITEGKQNSGEPLVAKDLDKFGLDKKGFEKVKTIHTNWYVHSMKALIAQLSRNILPKLDSDTRREFADCLQKIHDMKDLVESSKCVVRAREQLEELRRREGGRRKVKTTKKLAKVRKAKKVKEVKEVKKVDTSDTMSKKIKKLFLLPLIKPVGPSKDQIRKRLIIEYKEKWRNQKKLTNKLRKSDNVIEMNEKRKRRRRGQSVRRTKRSLRRLVLDTVSKSDSSGYHVKSMDHMPELSLTNSKSPVKRVANLLKALVSNPIVEKTDDTWADTYKTLLKMKKRMDAKEKEPGARVYNQRMYDLVLDHNSEGAGINMFEKARLPSLMKSAFDLMSIIDGSGKKGPSDSNIKFLSPRFASLMPDKNENRGKLSPSILSFYNDDSEDQIVPLPKMLDATGMSGKDRDTVIELVMEMSGAKGIVKDAMKVLKAVDMPELNGAVTKSAEKSIKMVQEIQSSYDKKQKYDMKKKGFAMMEPMQMQKLMTDQGIGGRDDIFNVNQYAKMTMFERKEMVWDMVRQIAFGVDHTMSHNSTFRTKRQASVWGPHILQPTVLSPILFTPIYGLNVLGPTVLSPGLFTPLILNPAVLSPYVFSPTVVIPFILSPYVLSPYVFSPLIMAPFILNPYVLSPNVFNPYVLSPLVLSPLVLCPDVVSPMTLGGAILSPGVLSPSVLSKSYIMANVLSPTVLSK